MSHKPNALKSRLISFFMQNPTEELTVDDICIKFDCTEMQARTTRARINSESMVRLEIVRVVKLAKVA